MFQRHIFKVRGKQCHTFLYKMLVKSGEENIRNIEEKMNGKNKRTKQNKTKKHHIVQQSACLFLCQLLHNQMF